MSAESHASGPYERFTSSPATLPDDGEERFFWEAPHSPVGDETMHELRHNSAASIGVSPDNLIIFFGNELWTNAERYSHLISVRIRLIGRTVVIEVCDDGIPPEAPYTRPEDEGGIGLNTIFDSINGQCGRDPTRNMMWCAVPLELDEAA